MRQTSPFFLVLFVLGLSACAQTSSRKSDLPPVQTVNSVDLKRYLGKWFEISSIPQSFSKGCVATTANYTVRENEPDKIQIVNECRRNSFDGELTVATGIAHVADKKTNSKLRVSFFRPFYGDYWIIDLGKDYEFAVVGTPSRDALWILSRTPIMSGSLYDAIVSRAAAQGFDVSRLVITRQLK